MQESRRKVIGEMISMKSKEKASQRGHKAVYNHFACYYSIFSWKEEKERKSLLKQALADKNSLVYSMSQIKEIYLFLIKYPEGEKQRIKKDIQHKYDVKSLILLSPAQAQKVIEHDLAE